MAVRTKCEICRKLRKSGQPVKESNCQRHKERRYEAVIWNKGNQLTKTFNTYKEAEEWSVDTGKDIRRGAYRKLAPITFGEVADKYLNSRGPLRPAGVTLYKYIVNDYLKPILGNHKMTSINSDMVDEVLASVNGRSFSLRQKVQTHLKAIFKLAVAKDLAFKDYTLHLQPMKRTKRVVYNILDNNQINQLLTLPNLPGWLRLYYQISIYTGQRPEETGGLSIPNIHLDRGEIDVRQSVYFAKNQGERDLCGGKPYILGPLKTPQAYRTIPIGKDLVRDIEVYMMDGYKENKHNLLFATPKGDPIYYNNIRRDHWYTHRKLASLPPIDLYELRHTYCSILADQGVPLQKIKELMGHSDISTTSNIYTHVMKGNDSHIADAFEKYVNSGSSPYSCHTHVYPQTGEK